MGSGFTFHTFRKENWARGASVHGKTSRVSVGLSNRAADLTREDVRVRRFRGRAGPARRPGRRTEGARWGANWRSVPTGATGPQGAWCRDWAFAFALGSVRRRAGSTCVSGASSVVPGRQRRSRAEGGQRRLPHPSGPWERGVPGPVRMTWRSRCPCHVLYSSPRSGPRRVSGARFMDAELARRRCRRRSSSATARLPSPVCPHQPQGRPGLARARRRGPRGGRPPARSATEPDETQSLRPFRTRLNPFRSFDTEVFSFCRIFSK